MTVSIVVGNPKPSSRTLSAARLVAQRLTGAPPDVVIDVVELGDGLLRWGDEAVGDAVKRVADSDVLVCASPTFKATYSGLLKLFLDQFSTRQLTGVTAFAVMLGAAPEHAMAPELLLKPVLVELGATCPTQGLYLLESQWEESERLDSWIESASRYTASGVQR
ncbi:NADPH-dependent FMN reductase [Mycolicibacterium mengxianglii]|uniref:NADPH-dependent FMN reductase n=1 Tax=Mycolicibacterium mengxianglii TaxID=2736649 RepID=UPI0018D17797|nr:NAD(P)H-dependent oxidoreductase [Mycolicibacterium mengxianglii]